MRALLRLIATVATVALAGTLLSVSGGAATAQPAVAPQAAPAPAVDHARLDASRLAERRAARCYRKCFGAISMSPDQAWGGQYNTPTRKKAVRKAYARCRNQSNYPGRCRKLGWVRNGCMAVAIKTDRNGWVTRWSTGYGETLRGAKRQAKRRNGGGHIRAWLCTSN